MKKQRKRDTKSFRKEIKKKQTIKKGKCSSVIHPLLPVISEFKSFDTRKFLTKETLKNGKDLKYIISTDNIPNEIKKNVKEIIKKNTPRSGQCLWYSKYLTSQIKGLKQILGLFELEEYKQLGYLFPTNEIIEFDGTTLTKDEKDNVWGIHSWNEYNGVHFDCLKDGIYDKVQGPKRFLRYKILKDIKFESDSKISEYMNSHYEIISQSLQSNF